MQIHGNNIFINQNAHIVSHKVSAHTASHLTAMINENKAFSDKYKNIKVRKAPQSRNIDSKKEHDQQTYNEVAQEDDNFHDILI